MPGADPAHGEWAALADVAVAVDERTLAADHQVGGVQDAVQQRVTAAVRVVELGVAGEDIGVAGDALEVAGTEIAK